APAPPRSVEEAPRRKVALAVGLVIFRWITPVPIVLSPPTGYHYMATFLLFSRRTKAVFRAGDEPSLRWCAVQIEGSYMINAPREHVFEVLRDPAMLQ